MNIQTLENKELMQIIREKINSNFSDVVEAVSELEGDLSGILSSISNVAHTKTLILDDGITEQVVDFDETVVPLQGSINESSVIVANTNADGKVTFTKDKTPSRVQSDVESRYNPLIPTQASSINQLADKDFVTSSVSGMLSRYITSTAAGNELFESFDALNAGDWFYQGSIATPENNDYALYINADNQTQRGTFDGVQWNASYVVHDTPLTSAQISALNSEITYELVLKLLNPDTSPEGGSQQLITSGAVYSGLDDKLDKASIIDSLSSTSTSDALSSNMGRVLNDTKLTTIGIDITEEGIDLNDYISPRRYRCSSSAIVPTLLNKPVELVNTFTMDVETVSGTNCMQIIKVSSSISNIFVRTGNPTTGVWQQWVSLGNNVINIASGDFIRSVVILHRYTNDSSARLARTSLNGRLTLQRGGTSSGSRLWTAEIATQTAYNSTSYSARIIDVRGGAETGKFATCVLEDGFTYLCLVLPYASANWLRLVFDGYMERDEQSLRYIPYFNDQTSTVLNQNVNDSLTILEDIIPSTQQSGTWTPNLYGATTAGTIGYEIQEGKWNISGNMRTLTFRIKISSISGTVGQMRIGGMPLIPVEIPGIRDVLIRNANILMQQGDAFTFGTQSVLPYINIQILNVNTDDENYVMDTNIKSGTYIEGVVQWII